MNVSYANKGVSAITGTAQTVHNRHEYGDDIGMNGNSNMGQSKLMGYQFVTGHEKNKFAYNSKFSIDNNSRGCPASGFTSIEITSMTGHGVVTFQTGMVKLCDGSHP